MTDEKSPMTTRSNLTALITGASSGIGYDLAKEFASHGYDVVLVARSKDKLEQLTQELRTTYGIKAVVLAQDLSAVGTPQTIFEQTEKSGITVDILINNAGFGSYGLFHELDLQKELEMIQLNISALVYLTRLFLPGMVARHQGKILNVASTAAFQPGPLMAVYSATKVFILHFSEAIANELEGTGVTVTALCPGRTETGFEARAVMQDSKLMQSGLMSSASVAKAGYAALMQGKTLLIPGFPNRMIVGLLRLMPRKLVTRFVRNVQERGSH
jgi:short-subunit dehydrogenase